MSPDMPSSWEDYCWLWLDVAGCLPLLAPALAPGISITRPSISGQKTTSPPCSTNLPDVRSGSARRSQPQTRNLDDDAHQRSPRASKATPPSATTPRMERHRAELLGQPVHTDPVDAAAALLHAIARLYPAAVLLGAGAMPRPGIEGDQWGA
jgi:hypothetical protein